MMLKIFMLFLLLIAGIIIAPNLVSCQSHILIQTNNYNIEASILSLVIIFILVMISIFVIEWSLCSILNTKIHTFCGLFVNFKQQNSHKQMEKMLLKLVEGDHQQVEKLMAKNINYTAQPVVNYLLAAEAAQWCDDTDRANQYLERVKAFKLKESDRILLEITLVRLQLARKENHAAHRSVATLLKTKPYHPEILRLAKQIYVRTCDWNALLDIIPFMEKTKFGNAEQRQALQQQAWIGLIDQIRKNQSSNDLKMWWNNQSRKIRQQTLLQAKIAEHFIECGNHDVAQQIILDGLEQQYDDHLVMIISRLNIENPEQIERVLRQKIKISGNRPLLWSTLGQLLMKRGEWKEANLAFRTALRQRPDAFDYAFLAETLDKLHQSEEAEMMRHKSRLLLLAKEEVSFNNNPRKKKNLNNNTPKCVS